MQPLISVIIPTFNRAKTIARTIDSVLLQTYTDFEIIVVEDGSVDGTNEILRGFNDKRLRIIIHDVNKGVTAAKNTGLDNIRGQWFTILDSDDEILPEALEEMMKIPLELDSSVNAVSCNCKDTATGTFSGFGLISDQYVDFKTVTNVCTGEFWGITKTELLLNDRFNNMLGGFENTLWYKINLRAKRYYIHKALRIYHTEGDDRVSKAILSIKKLSRQYQALSSETLYLETLNTYLPDTFAKNCLRAVLCLVSDNKKEHALFYYKYLDKVKGKGLYKKFSFLVIHSNAYVATLIIKFMSQIKII